MFGSDVYSVYCQIIKQPIDFGTIISKLIECEYNNINELKNDIELMVSNCEIYWSQKGNEFEVTNHSILFI